MLLEKSGKQCSAWCGFDAKEGKVPFHVGLHRNGISGIGMLLERFLKWNQIGNHSALNDFLHS